MLKRLFSLVRPHTRVIKSKKGVRYATVKGHKSKPRSTSKRK